MICTPCFFVPSPFRAFVIKHFCRFSAVFLYSVLCLLIFAPCSMLLSPPAPSTKDPSSFVVPLALLNFYPVKSQRAISLGPAGSGTIQLRMFHFYSNRVEPPGQRPWPLSGGEGLLNRGERPVLKNAFEKQLAFLENGVYNKSQNDLIGEST